MSERGLSKEMAAARALRESIAAIAGDDPDTIRDTIEGETGLHEAIGLVMGEITESEILCVGLSVMIESLCARRSARESRMKRLRAAIEQAMQIGEIKSLALPDATLTLKNVPPKVVIEDEAKVPAKFWKPSDPTLDRVAVKEAIKAGEPVEGASMGNGSVTLQIRRT